MPAKLTAAQVVALAAHLPVSTPLGKQKHPFKEEALVGMARVFPSANPTSLMNTQVAVSGAAMYEILMKSPHRGSIHLYEEHPPRLS